MKKFIPRCPLGMSCFYYKKLIPSNLTIDLGWANSEICPFYHTYIEINIFDNVLHGIFRNECQDKDCSPFQDLTIVCEKRHQPSEVCNFLNILYNERIKKRKEEINLLNANDNFRYRYYWRILRQLIYDYSRINFNNITNKSLPRDVTDIITNYCYVFPHKNIELKKSQNRFSTFRVKEIKTKDSYQKFHLLIESQADTENFCATCGENIISPLEKYLLTNFSFLPRNDSSEGVLRCTVEHIKCAIYLRGIKIPIKKYQKIYDKMYKKDLVKITDKFAIGIIS